MASKTIYFSETAELEVCWSEKGIHLEIMKYNDGNTMEIILDESDIDSLIFDLECYRDALNKE